ncbi:C40 family peptidase [Lysobacter humi (ex Lee et al. 2017)]
MTGSNTHRPFTSALRSRGSRWMLAALLALVAAPALAQRAPAGMSTDTEEASSSVVRDSMSLSDRALILANDVNRLLLPGSRPAAEPATGRVQSVLSRALGLLGTPYRWGGTSPEGGFDCSGLVGYVFRNALGIELPRVSRDMAKTGEMVADRGALTAGDLVFFGKSGTVDHVGIYLGEGKFVHAPRTGRDVTVSRLDTGYWGAKFLQGRRVQGI